MRRFSWACGVILSVGYAIFAANNIYKDTIWVPVIFYDYWVDGSGTNPDFQSASAGRTNGMVATTLDPQKKPVPVPAIACPSPDPGYPRACHLAEWFRVSGRGGSDATCLFQCDSVSNPLVQRWFWSTATGGALPNYLGRVGEYIGPNYDSTYNMRNIIIYDSLPFRHLGRTNPQQIGVYEYDNSSFFRLDGRGYGTQPTGSGHNFGFAMEMHAKFTYRPGITFYFRGDDDVWAFVNKQLVMDIGGRHAAIADSFNLDNVSGLQLDSSYSFDFFYAERYTTLSNIRITTNILTSQPTELKLSVDSATICAGEKKQIIGTITDQFGKVMRAQSDSIRWVIDSTTYRRGDSILVPMGDTTIVTGITAWRGFRVIASFGALKDTAFITINACTPAKVDIELQNTTSLTEAQVLAAVKLNDSTPKLTIYFDSTLTRMYVYAVVRDIYNNFVDLARTATWTSQLTDTATVAGTTGKLFEGVIDRTPGARTGRTEIYALTTGLIPDTALVILRTDRIIALRLVDVRQPTIALDTIKMTTDQSMTIQVQGKWSTDPTVWVNVTGMWSMTPPNAIQSTIPIPTTETGIWQSFDPINSGTATLTVVNGTASVSVPVIISEAPPSKLTLKLVTHPDSCYAGVPIKITGQIFNNDGLVDGMWDGTSVYSDILNNALRTLLPWLTVNNRATPDSLNKALPERFTNGKDTFLLVLYYAPLSDDSLHQIKLALSGSPYGVLIAETIRFKLKPGPIDSIQIEDRDKNHKIDTIKLISPNESIQLYVTGFDKYGNKIVSGSAGGDPLLTVIWRTDSTLHRTSDSIGPNITYVTNTVVYPEKGRMWTILVVNGDTLKDYVPITITAPKTAVTSAITRDIDGNGFIDRIEVKFNKKADLTAANTQYFNMKYPALPSDPTTSNVSTVSTNITKLSDSSYAIDFIERSNPRYPQTAWKPYLVIASNPLDLTPGSTLASDGCPPVIWAVTKYLNRDNDRSKDTVVVDFSEQIVSSDGAAFKISDQPVLTFNCWYRNPDSTFTPVDSMFSDAPAITSYFKPISRDSTVYFLMSNGNDLYNVHWLNIKTSPPPSPVLKDKAVGNVPTAVNHKVNVIVKGNYETIQIIPNPSRGTFVRRSQIGDSTISNIHTPNARTWVKNDRAGTVISVSNIRVPTDYSINDPKTWPKGYAKIYDVVGNTVNFVQVPNWLAGVNTSTGSGMTIDLYWTGANSKGMMVAPGIYRVVAYVDYPSSQKDLHDKRLIARAGIMR
jgi:fibro-slime domain-containing protein